MGVTKKKTFTYDTLSNYIDELDGYAQELNNAQTLATALGVVYAACALIPGCQGAALASVLATAGSAVYDRLESSVQRIIAQFHKSAALMGDNSYDAVEMEIVFTGTMISGAEVFYAYAAPKVQLDRG